MTVGMAGVAGTILAAYASFIGEEAVPFLLAATFMSAPGCILMAKIIIPDDAETIAADEKAKLDTTEISETFGEGQRPANVIEAAAQGTQTGVKLAVAVGAMVLGLDIQTLVFRACWVMFLHRMMYLIGITDWDQAQLAGELFGTKIVLNEFVAFIDLGQISGLTERSRSIITFALCGFANFSSIAIQMAVTGGLAPNQRPVIAKLGLKALAAGSLANLMSAALAGLLLPL